MTRLLLVLILLVGIFTEISLPQTSGKADNTVRCEAWAAHMYGKAGIRCNYPINLDKQPLNMSVDVRHIVNDTDTHVLDCIWHDILNCTNVRKGFNITQVTFNTLTISIPTVMEEHLGRYRCRLLDRTDSYPSELCDLLGPLPYSPKPTETDQSGPLPYSPKPTETDQSVSDQCSSVSTIVAIVLGILLFIMIVVVVLLLVLYCRKRSRSKDTETTGTQTDCPSAPGKPSSPSTATTPKRPGTAAAAAGDRADIPERPELSTDPLLPDQPEDDKERAEGKEDETIEILADPGSPGHVLQPESPHTPDTNKKAKEEEDKKEDEKEKEEEEEEEEDKKEDEKEKEEEEEEKKRLLGSSEHSATPGAGPRSDAGYAQKPESSAPGPPRQGHAGQRT